MADTTFAKPQIIPYGEECTDGITLFDCKWVPSSPRFVVLGSHIKNHGIIRIYSLTSSSKIKQNAEAMRPSPIKCGTFGATTLEDRNLGTIVNIVDLLTSLFISLG